VKPKGVTMTVLLAKAAAMALAQHPVVNSTCRDGKSFTYNSNINIAVAVAIDGGLITPVLQDADKLDIYLLSQNWKDLVKKARAKQLQPNDYNSGTFTLSNLGMFGVDRFDAILPPGQGAIMALWLIKMYGEILIVLLLLCHRFNAIFWPKISNFAMENIQFKGTKHTTCIHQNLFVVLFQHFPFFRIVYGADLAAFLQTFAKIIEDPESLTFSIVDIQFLIHPIFLYRFLCLNVVDLVGGDYTNSSADFISEIWFTGIGPGMFIELINHHNICFNTSEGNCILLSTLSF
ncbi:hypothetical protein ACJX0J_020406, partial [Zea mays]